jgi:hypothetical protein
MERQSVVESGYPEGLLLQFIDITYFCKGAPHVAFIMVPDLALD